MSLVDYDRIEPVHIGPTWEPNPHWDGVTPSQQYLLPSYTFGMQVLRWIRENLLSEESTDERPIPFQPTFEQQRFILWWYAVDENGRFLYRDGVLQRLKGWGKDPLLAVICVVELLGPCRFGGWLTVDRPELDLFEGDPIGVEHPRAWVQVAAVSQTQTQNTMDIFSGLISQRCQQQHGMKKDSIGKTQVTAHGGQRKIQAVTSSPATMEGNRPTFVVRNETHHWKKNNDGHAMDEVIGRNATKAKGGAARTLSITNAYQPGEDSVAQRQREAYEAEASGLAIGTRALYDSLEAPRKTVLAPDWPEAEVKAELLAEGIEPDDASIWRRKEELTRAHIAALLRGVRGDATWLDIPTITDAMLDRRNPPSLSRRFYLNQVVTTEDAYLDAEAVKLAVHPLAAEARRAREGDALRAGWLVLPEDPIVVFFDGSKSDDATGLVGCRLSDGYVFTLGVWQRPPRERGEAWIVDRAAVTARVHEVFARFNVVGFWADPSHALDDAAEAGRFWDSTIDAWHREFKERLQLWAIKTGDNQHSIMWDMTSPTRQAMFVAEAERFKSEMEHRNDIEEFEPLVAHDGHPALIDHLTNAIGVRAKYGDSLAKEHRESAKKIDLAVCAIGARMLRRAVLNRGVEESPDAAGTVWGAW